MVKKAVLLLVLSVLAAHSQVNYPYPQRKNYGNGTINATSSRASADLQGKFKNFLKDFYVEGQCGSTPCARIKFDSPKDNETVSEGIGYAMIMMVYFSDNTTSYKTHFDKLWAYYKHFRNGNGVMNWKIEGFNNATGQNGATDAELDVALALAMARYQFNDAKYETDARDLIGVIKQHEVSSDGLLKPGDAWEADRNPSYVAPAAFEIFEGLSNDWTNTIRTRNYTFLKANQTAAGSTGLPSGWANTDGSTKVCSNNCGITSIAYDQDAVRAPWRWATANAWFGHTDAKTLLTKLATWVSTKNALDIKGPIKLNGDMGTDASSGYIGSLMCALTHDSKYQSNLNSYWSTLMGNSGESYFNQALQVLFGLLVTGNMPNLKACDAGNCGTDMGSGGYNGEYTSIDKFQAADSEDDDDRGYAATWEPWYAYTDVGSDGSSTIANGTFTSKDENDECKEKTSYNVVVKDGDEWIAKIVNYDLIKGDNKYAPYVALGLDARNNGKPVSEGGYDLSQCTGGFSYEYKGEAHNFKVQTSVVTQEGADHFKTVTEPSTTWKLEEFGFEDLAQPTWATKPFLDFDPTKIYAFAWELKGHDDGPPKLGVSAYQGSLAIKNFRCKGNLENLPQTRGASSCSSSPIKSSQFAKANRAMQPIRNGVSLQVATNATLEVYNLKGKLLQKQAFTNGNWPVQFSDLPKGLYIVKAQLGSHREILQVPVK